MSGSEPQSPTALVQAYLASKGLPLTAQNVSRVLQMNATNPGVIPGLTNQAPPPPDAPQVPQARRPQSQPQPQAQPQAQEPLPTPPIPPSTIPGASAPTTASSSSTTAPQQDEGHSWLASLLETILGGGAGILGGHTALGRNGAEPMGNMPMPNSGRVMGVPGAAINGPQAQGQLSGASPLQLENPQASIGGPSPQPQGQPQVGGPSNHPQLNTPQEKPAIRLPNEASGPTIPLPTSGLSGMGEPLNMGGARPQMPQMGESLNWGKILGEAAPMLKRLRP
jgi:hypothetical protein